MNSLTNFLSFTKFSKLIEFIGLTSINTTNTKKYNQKLKYPYELVKTDDDDDDDNDNDDYDIELGLSYEQTNPEINTDMYLDLVIDQTDPDTLSDNCKYQHKLKQIPIGQLIWSLIYKNLSLGFAMNMGLNILLSSIMIPGLIKLSNEYLIGGLDLVYQGFIMIILAIGCEIISTIHRNTIIEPYKRKFVSLIHSDLEEEISGQILKINWNVLRELNNNELDRKKDTTKWYILGFINMFISTFINLFSFLGYMGWVGFISPFSLVVYFFMLSLLVIYYPHKNEKNSDKCHELWNKYYNIQTKLYTDIIHHKGSESLDQMKKCICEIESKRDQDKKSDSVFTDSINVVFNLAFIINCLCLYWFSSTKFLSNPSDIIIYIQYSCMMKSSVIMCISLYTQYSDAKREYTKLEEILSNTFERINFDKHEIDFNSITIKSLKYVYPQDSNISNKPFELVLAPDTTLSFKLGQIIRFDGNSGHGKSTFSDIINGIIPFGEYKTSVYLDDPDMNKRIIGFDVLTKYRYYNEQTESICWKPSVYEIISGKTITRDEFYNPVNIDKYDEDIVWKALTICSCLDFLKKDNVTNELKWIYTRNIGLSGGQRGRVALARSIYRVMTMYPKIITLDEVDKSIQSELVVEVMKNIFKFARTNNILVFVICHNSDVKNLNEYNQVINFTNGIITRLS